MRGAAVLEVAVAACCLGVGCAVTRPVVAPAPQTSVAPAVAQPATPSAPASHGSGLLFAVTPTDAEVLVDGKLVGRVRDFDARGGLLAIKPGIYQVALKRRGFLTWRAEVTVGEGAEAIQVTMVESP